MLTPSHRLPPRPTLLEDLADCAPDVGKLIVWWMLVFPALCVAAAGLAS